MRLSTLLHDIGKLRTREVSEDGKVHFLNHDVVSAEMIDPILRRLVFPNDVIHQVQFLEEHHMDAKNWKDDLSRMKQKHLRKLQFVCGTEERFRQLMLLIDADNRAHAEGYCLEHQVDLILEATDRMKHEGSALFDYKQPLTGKDVIALKGIKPGPAVKECLDYLMKLAFVNPLRDKEEWKKYLVGYKPKS